MKNFNLCRSLVEINGQMIDCQYDEGHDPPHRNRVRDGKAVLVIEWMEEKDIEP